MLEQQQIHAEEPNQYAPTAYENNNAALALTPHAAALVAAYVAHIEAEQQDATRTRLKQLLAAHLELDAEPEQAARSAIQQIKNERIAAENQQATAKRQAFEQRKRTRGAKQSVRPATLTALKLFGPGALTLIGSTTVLLANWPNEAVLFHLLPMLYFGLPALLGILVGVRARHRPAMGTLYAIGALLPLTQLLAALVMNPFEDWDRGMVFLALILMLFWLPIGVVSAGLTGWGRDALRRKRRQEASTRATQLKE